MQEFIHEEEVEEIQRVTRKRERLLIAILYACRCILAIFSPCSIVRAHESLHFLKADLVLLEQFGRMDTKGNFFGQIRSIDCVCVLVTFCAKALR